MPITIPPLHELREMFADVMSDETITDISYWNEPNTDCECNEQEYLQNSLNNGDVLNETIKEALDSVHRKEHF